MYLTSITPILNVSDVPASIDWFLKLGWNRCFSWNEGGRIAGGADRNEHGPAHFAGVGCGEVEVFLCRDGQGSRGMPPTAEYMAQIAKLPMGVSPDEDTGGVWISWWVKTPAEVDEAHRLALRHGMAVVWPPTNEPW